jgi:molybdate transport system ATP-binding protein
MTWNVSVRMRLGALDLDVDIGGGDAPVALVGPNGAGKTTLLRTIAGAHRPDAGTIVLGDRPVFDSGSGVDVPPEARHVGYVPQGYGLFPHLSAIDNVAFGWISRTPRRSRAERRATAADVLERMGCAHLAARMPATLSGGEQQRVALARALAVEPHALLFDEPLAALDVHARGEVRTYLAGYLERLALPTVIVTHDAADARQLGSRIAVLEAGRVTQIGTWDELCAHPASAFVERFVYMPASGTSSTHSG